MAEELKRGTRVALVRCNDPLSKLKKDDEGELMFIDNMGTYHIKWDNGSNLGLCPDDGDAFRVVSN